MQKTRRNLKIMMLKSDTKWYLLYDSIYIKCEKISLISSDKKISCCLGVRKESKEGIQGKIREGNEAWRMTYTFAVLIVVTVSQYKQVQTFKFTKLYSLRCIFSCQLYFSFLKNELLSNKKTEKPLQRVAIHWTLLLKII